MMSRLYDYLKAAHHGFVVWAIPKCLKPYAVYQRGW